MDQQQHDISSTPPPNPKKSRVIFSNMVSIVLGITGVVLVILIIGLGALLASHTLNPKWNPFGQSSNTDKIIRENIIKEMRK